MVDIWNVREFEPEDEEHVACDQYHEMCSDPCGQKILLEHEEMKRLLRWAQHWIPRNAPNCLEFLDRAYKVLGEEYAMSGSAKLTPKKPSNG